MTWKSIASFFQSSPNGVLSERSLHEAKVRHEGLRMDVDMDEERKLRDLWRPGWRADAEEQELLGWRRSEYESMCDHGAFVIVGHKRDYWEMKDTADDSHVPRSALHAVHESHVLRIAKSAIQFMFFSVHFFSDELTERERGLYEQAPSQLSVQITRPPPACHGRTAIMELGVTIDRLSLQIERVVEHGVISRNSQGRVIPGYRFTCVNGKRRNADILHELGASADLVITLSRPL